MPNPPSKSGPEISVKMYLISLAAGIILFALAYRFGLLNSFIGMWSPAPVMKAGMVFNN